MRKLIASLVLSALSFVACGGAIERVPGENQSESSEGSIADPSGSGAGSSMPTEAQPKSRAPGEVYTLVREDNLRQETGRIVSAWCEKESHELVGGHCDYRKGYPERAVSYPTSMWGVGKGWACGGEGDPFVEVSSFATCRAR